MKRVMALLVLVGCSEPALRDTARVEAAPFEAAPREAGLQPRRVIAKLVTRDHVLWVHPGDEFSVTSRDGRVLASVVPMDELEDRYAELHEAYRTGTATVVSPGAPYLDASLDLR